MQRQGLRLGGQALGRALIGPLQGEERPLPEQVGLVDALVDLAAQAGIDHREGGLDVVLVGGLDTLDDFDWLHEILN